MWPGWQGSVPPAGGHPESVGWLLGAGVLRRGPEQHRHHQGKSPWAAPRAPPMWQWCGSALWFRGCPRTPATSGCPQALVKEANAHGEKLSSLEAVASRLKDFSRKQDGAVIQNLVLTAKERLGKVLQHTAERGAALEEARKRTKQVPGRGGEGTGPAGSCAALPVAPRRCAPALCALHESPLPAAVQRVPAAAPGLDGRGGAGPGGAAGHGHEPGGDQVPAG